MKDAIELMPILQHLGGYSLAALLYWMFKTEREERVRYRDLHEETIRSLPELTETLREVAKEIKEQAK